MGYWISKIDSVESSSIIWSHLNPFFFVFMFCGVLEVKLNFKLSFILILDFQLASF